LNAARRHGRDRQQQLQLLQARLQRHHPGQLVRQLHTRLEFCQRQLPLLMQRNLRQHRQRWSAAAQLLHSVSPLATLQRGYAIVGNERGEVLRDVRDAPPGSTITARLAFGQMNCTVQSIQTDSIQPPENE
jgi:exodeoxyribonuclease VII large subunit